MGWLFRPLLHSRIHKSISLISFSPFGRHNEAFLYNIDRLPPTFLEMRGVCDPTTPNLIPLSKPKFFTIAIGYGKLRGRRKARVGSLRLAMAGYGDLVHSYQYPHTLP
jgi:hypothetical protein